MKMMPRTRRIFGKGGVKFTDAYVTTPVCCPSRSSIFTGLYAHNHQVRTNGFGASDALDQERTMQYHLQQAGYHTAIFGKYFNGREIERDPLYFDEWALLNRGYRDVDWNIDGEIRKLRAYSTNVIRNRAVGFIRELRNNEQPWMLYLAPFAPHLPADPAKRFERAVIPEFVPNPAVLETTDTDDGVRDKPPRVQAEATTSIDRARRVRRKQLRSLLSVDILVKKVFEALEETGQADETLAILTSDNGYFWGEHGLGGKGAPYIQAIEVPLYLRWPRHVPPGTRDDRIAANIDIAPTILDAARVLPAEEMDGSSLLEPSGRDRLLIEGFGANSRPDWFYASTKTKEYQYTEWYSDGDHKIPDFAEYYDLIEDPWQLDNLVVDLDTTNDPNYPLLHQRLQEDKTCRGSDCP